MSTIDKRKALSSEKYSIKEHYDEQSDGNNREIKNNIDEILIDEVHTANDWEHADLGDEQRKQKFLRLMGAKKRKDESRVDTKDFPSTTHEDTLSLEKKHCRSTTQNESISRELEKQFNEGLQSKILHTHHEGLGFQNGEVNSSTDCSYEQMKTKFVPATTQTKSSSSSNKTVTNDLEEVKDKLNGKE